MFDKIKAFIVMKRAQKLADSTLNDIGQLIDMPMKSFKRYIKRKKLNAGQTKMLIDQFTAMYENLVCRKDELVKRAQTLKNENKRKEYEENIVKIFLVLQRLEYRIVWLKKRYTHLLGEI